MVIRQRTGPTPLGHQASTWAGETHPPPGYSGATKSPLPSEVSWNLTPIRGLNAGRSEPVVHSVRSRSTCLLLPSIARGDRFTLPSLHVGPGKRPGSRLNRSRNIVCLLLSSWCRGRQTQKSEDAWPPLSPYPATPQSRRPPRGCRLLLRIPRTRMNAAGVQ